jgi:hypothetical protein
MAKFDYQNEFFGSSSMEKIDKIVIISPAPLKKILNCETKIQSPKVFFGETA